MVDNHVFTTAGAKGGVGKTTTSLNLAAALNDSGYSVVAVEMDLPMPNFLDFVEFDFDPSNDPSIRHVLEGSVAPQEVIYETPNGLSVLPSASDLASYEHPDLSGFPDMIDELRWYFDIVFIDTPAGISEESKQSLMAGDQALFVSTPRVASIQNATKTIEFARQQDATNGGFLLNKSGTGASPGMDTIAEAVDVDVLGHIPEDEAVPHAQDMGMPVVQHSPNSAASVAYTRVAQSIVGSHPNQESTHEHRKNKDLTTEAESPEDNDKESPGVNEPAAVKQLNTIENTEDKDPAEDDGAMDETSSKDLDTSSPENDGQEHSSTPNSQEETDEDGGSDTHQSSPQSDSLLKKIQRSLRSE